MYYISVIILIRDGEKYLQYIDKQFSKIETEYKNSITLEYYIYENDSVDETKNKMKMFFKNRNGKYFSENISDEKMFSGISMDRGEKMAKLRNNLKEKHGVLQSDYVLLLDCDVIFLENSIIKMISNITTIQNTVMVTPYCICWDWFCKHNDPNHYYDSLAFITNDNICFKDNYNTCMFDNCNKCKTTRNLKNIKVDSLLSNKNIVNVNSAFGGFVIIKTDVYNKVNWGNSICEHHSFCKNVREYGNIIINPNIKTIITIPERRNYSNIYAALINLTKNQIETILLSPDANNILLCENQTVKNNIANEEININKNILVKNMIIQELNMSREKSNISNTYTIKVDLGKYEIS